MVPAIAGALIGAGASVGGGLLSAFFNRQQQKEALSAQEEFARHGIQWRVEDAKAAGLHPLYALGASTTGPTVPVMSDPIGPSISQAGQDIGRAVAAQETPDQADARKMSLAVGASQIARNYSEAAMFDSQAARNLQERNARPGMPAVTGGLAPTPAQLVSGASPTAVQVVPSQSTAHAPSEPGIEAAVGTGLKFFNIPGGRRILLPAANSMSEALESVSESYLLSYLVARENMKANPNFLRENAHWFPFGKELLNTWDAFRGGSLRFNDGPHSPAGQRRRKAVMGRSSGL